MQKTSFLYTGCNKSQFIQYIPGWKALDIIILIFQGKQNHKSNKLILNPS